MGLSGPTGTEVPQPDGLIDTTNDYLLGTGENLPNSTWASRGQARYVTQILQELPVWRVRQDAYRYAAWLISLAEILPDSPEETGVTFEQVQDAIRNT